MIIVDNALEQRETAGKPVRVGLIGAGYMGRAIVRQFLKPLRGMRLVAVVSRAERDARRVLHEAGISDLRRCDTARQVEDCVAAGEMAVGEDAAALYGAGPVDVIIECTGDVEFGARVALGAFENGKHLVLLNAALGATAGPILKWEADRAGVVFTDTDGDEPGVAMNLVRFVRTVGCQPVCAGNLKGMLDRYRTPDTQAAFAAAHHQKPAMVTSFADGTKLSMETTVLANATGFRVARRGMLGHACQHVNDATRLFSPELFEEGGLVEYLLGAAPHTGAFVLALERDPVSREYASYFKMGDGPLYCDYPPYHLPHLQVASTVARAALFHDATVAPAGKPCCDVITMAKRDLAEGDVLDGIGGFCCYGTIENADVAIAGRHLPIGLSRGCRVRRDLPRDHALTYEDVDMPPAATAATLRERQDTLFFGKPPVSG